MRGTLDPLESRRRPIGVAPWSAGDVCRAWRQPGRASLWFPRPPSAAGNAEPWGPAGLLAHRPARGLTARLSAASDADRALDALELRIAERRREPGSGDTGLAVLLAYDAWSTDPSRADDLSSIQRGTWLHRYGN